MVGNPNRVIIFNFPKIIKISLILALLTGLLSGCSNLLYYPTPFKYVDEQKLEHVPFEIMLKYNKTTELTAWYFEAHKDKRKNLTFVFFHGNGQNQSAHFRSLYWILDYGYNFLIFDYPGYGPNPGSPNPENTVEAGSLAIQWVKANRAQDQIAIFGQSIGGNIALRTLSESSDLNPCLTVVESSFSSYRQVAQNVMKKSWITWTFQWLPYVFMSDAKAISTNISSLPKGNYIVIHSKTDEIVPYELGRDLYQQLPEQKQFWDNPGGNHTDAFWKSEKGFREKLISEIKNKCVR